MEAIDTSFQQITSIFFSGASRVLPAARTLFWTLAGIQCAFIIFRYAIYGKSEVTLLHLLIKVVITAIVVQYFPFFFRNILSLFVRLGGIAGGFRGVNTPSDIINVGLNAGDEILKIISSADQGRDVFQRIANGIGNLWNVLTLYICYWIIFACYLLITVQFILAYIEFYIVGGIGRLFISLAVLKETKFMTEKFTGSVIGHGIKILLLQFIIGSGLSVFSADIISNGVYDINAIDFGSDILPVVVNAIIFATLAMSVPSMATGILSGTPTLTSQALAQTAVAGAAAGKAAAQVGGAAARGAIQAKAGLTNVGGGISKALGAGQEAAKQVLSGGGTSRQATVAGLKSAGSSLTKSIGQGAKNFGTTAYQRAFQSKQQRQGQSFSDLHKQVNQDGGLAQLSSARNTKNHIQRRGRSGAIQGRRMGADEIKRIKERQEAQSPQATQETGNEAEKQSSLEK